MPSEQPAVISLPGALGAAGLALEGLFVPGERPGAAVVAAPHPQYGGRMDNPVVTELALRLGQVGCASLRFNWRGVGGSAGEASGDAPAADEDYAAALSFLEESVPGPLTAAGYSFGSAAAVRAAARSERIRRLVLVAPPPALIDAQALAAFGGEVFAIVGDRDGFAPLAEVRALFSPLERSTLAVLDETDHFFGSGTAELGRAFEAWLTR